MCFNECFNCEFLSVQEGTVKRFFDVIFGCCFLSCFISFITIG